MASRGFRIWAAVLSLPQLLTGAWAVIAPHNWFTDFPGFGPALVAGTPPFNDHLATDAGAGLFATSLALLIAACWGDTKALRIGLISFVAFCALHAFFHLTHASPDLSAGGNAYSSTLLVSEFVIGVVLLALNLRAKRQIAPI